MELLEFLIHLITAILSLVIVFISYELLTQFSNEFSNFFKYVLVGILPIALFHFFESLEFIKINLLPPDQTLAFEILEHSFELFFVVMVLVGIFNTRKLMRKK